MKNSSDYNVEISFNNYGFRDIKNLKNSKYSDFFVVGDSNVIWLGSRGKK